MTNSKYLDYEKTLDEIITKIETAEKLEHQQEEANIDSEHRIKKADYLNIFGLVNVASLATSMPTNTIVTASSEKVEQVASSAQDTSKILTTTPHKSYNLEAFINTKQHRPINLAEKLLVKMRKQMLNINHQFIVDLNRWKFIHSNESSLTMNAQQQQQLYDASQYSSKIHLKPHVNLNRPLLIRSKKLKRNATKLLLQSITTKPPPSSGNIAVIANTQKNVTSSRQGFNQAPVVAVASTVVASNSAKQTNPTSIGTLFFQFEYLFWLRSF